MLTSQRLTTTARTFTMWLFEGRGLSLRGVGLSLGGSTSIWGKQMEAILWILVVRCPLSVPSFKSHASTCQRGSFRPKSKIYLEPFCPKSDEIRPRNGLEFQHIQLATVFPAWNPRIDSISQSWYLEPTSEAVKMAGHYP